MVRRDTIPLPAGLSVELYLACIEVRMAVMVVTMWDSLQATLYDFPGEKYDYLLFVWADAGPARTEWTIRQSLADVGHPAFTDVPIEPFGRFPWEPAEYPDWGGS